MAGCGEGDSDRDGATGRTSTVSPRSTTTRDPEAAERQQVINAYLAAKIGDFEIKLARHI
jgi:hypothetical protein